MTTLNIAIVVVAVLVLLTFVWSMHSARGLPTERGRRRGLDRSSNERDLH
jgi:hypothetical protein